MFTKREKQDQFSEEVKHVLDYLSKNDPNTEEYTNAVSNLRTLMESQSKKPWYQPDLSILIPAGVSLLEIGLILWHENLHVITSKAVSFVIRSKL